MNNEKRGSEKLLNMSNELCSLTEEELSHVAGGLSLKDALDIGNLFPYGIFPPEHFEKMNIEVGKKIFGFGT